MLTCLNLVQLILYRPLLALAGQGLLYVLAGPKRDSNFVYRLLQLLSKPFTLVVRRLRKPLDSTVEQAHALVAGEFRTVPEPRVPELQRLTRAMNTMVSRLRVTLQAQAEQLDTLHKQANCDRLTGLSNRSHFLGQLGASLQREDGTAEGGLVLLRVLDLAGINRHLGHAGADRVITPLSQALRP